MVAGAARQKEGSSRPAFTNDGKRKKEKGSSLPKKKKKSLVTNLDVVQWVRGGAAGCSPTGFGKGQFFRLLGEETMGAVSRETRKKKTSLCSAANHGKKGRPLYPGESSVPHQTAAKEGEATVEIFHKQKKKASVTLHRKKKCRRASALPRRGKKEKEGRDVLLLDE